MPSIGGAENAACFSYSRAETGPYAGAKAGLNAITRSLAYEYGPNVRVNCMMCGPFHTDISKSWSRADGFTKMAKEHFALGRAGDPEVVVSTALYLASDASSFTTGAIVRVDGGAI